MNHKRHGLSLGHESILALLEGMYLRKLVVAEYL
jgi:hypothetical protein